VARAARRDPRVVAGTIAGSMSQLVKRRIDALEAHRASSAARA